MNAVVVDGLTHRFGEVTALDDVSFEVAESEIFGLIGPDGAGKTTLMRLLAGLLTPNGGQIELGGVDVLADPEAAKQKLGYLSQVFSLYGDLTIGENLDFVVEMFQEDRAVAAEAKQRLLEMTDLARFVDRQAGRLSGGMKQKLGLSCALIHRPQVLLLDEPTTGVDPLSRRDFWRLLADLPGQGVTIVLSSPYMDEAARCDRLALIDHGRLLATGTADELAARVKGTMLEVVSRDLPAVSAALAGAAELLGETTFGDALHVRWDGPDAEAAVLARLQAAGVAVQEVIEIEAGLEDAFVELVSTGGAS
ncbi:MAG TPA: multidrug ABC transporter ATP-binding protein [Armatimonadetes bacterium]|nr:multidrug ABC transporter ATP-binding protein [Armatimonadota bacterium]